MSNGIVLARWVVERWLDRSIQGVLGGLSAAKAQSDKKSGAGEIAWLIPNTARPLSGASGGMVMHMASIAERAVEVKGDASDVDAARSGDGEAYARIIRRHQGMIARRMMRFTRDRGTIEELVHDCFVEAFLSLRGFRGDAALEHWLTKIATRVGYRYWKSQKRNRSQGGELSEQLAARQQTGGDAADLAESLLAQLSPRDRLAITLIYLEERSVAEAAELAGWSQTMMKVQAFRARKKLRVLLEKQGICHE